MRIRLFVMFALMLLFFLSGSFAEHAFDPALLEGEEGFSINAEGEWVYQGSADKAFTDGILRFGVEVSTYHETGEILAVVFVEIADSDETSVPSLIAAGNPLMMMTRLDVVIGDGEWSWHSLKSYDGGGYAFLSPNESDFLAALQAAESVEVRIHYLQKKMILQYEAELESLRKMARTVLEWDMLDEIHMEAESITGQYMLEHPVHRSGSAIRTEELPR